MIKKRKKFLNKKDCVNFYFPRIKILLFLNNFFFLGTHNILSIFNLCFYKYEFFYFNKKIITQLFSLFSTIQIYVFTLIWVCIFNFAYSLLMIVSFFLYIVKSKYNSLLFEKS